MLNKIVHTLFFCLVFTSDFVFNKRAPLLCKLAVNSLATQFYIYHACILDTVKGSHQTH
jgi:hypothetical protein